jgi:uncharacterized protein (TIGR02646 family)
MIRIQRTYPEPPTLRSEKVQDARDAFTQRAQDGEFDFKFDSSFYAAEDVKQALIKMQHGKCCLCESKITHVAYGDVEHFRPKKAVLEDDGLLRRPGYYWLAYTWENLLLACEICNRREKRNVFPIEGERAKRPGDDLDQEQPLFIDPAGPDDPETLITFTDLGRAVAVDGNRRGQITIQKLGLNRDDLEEERRKRLQTLRWLVMLKRLAESQQDQEPLHQETLASAWEELARCIQADAEYAGMSRAFLRRYTV